MIRTIDLGQPKDIGKLEGLSLISKAWRNNGHPVLDIDFKGNRKGSGQSIMPYISYKFMRMLSSLNFKSYKDLFEIIFTDCAVKAEESSLEILVKWVVAHYSIILAMITSTVTGSLPIISIFRRYFSFCICLVLILFAILLFAIPLCLVWVNPNALIEYIKPINLTITGGDWQALVCYLNKLTLIKPDNRPILVIRELNCMDDETLLNCLSALERAK